MFACRRQWWPAVDVCRMLFYAAVGLAEPRQTSPAAWHAQITHCWSLFICVGRPAACLHAVLLHVCRMPGQCCAQTTGSGAAGSPALLFSDTRAGPAQPLLASLVSVYWPSDIVTSGPAQTVCVWCSEDSLSLFALPILENQGRGAYCSLHRTHLGTSPDI
jgi:hypothetical protein